jgi:hypothetical protein
MLPFIQNQCINLIVPSLITSRKGPLISAESHIPESVKVGITLENGYLYVYEDPEVNLLLFILDAEHSRHRHNPEDDHRFMIYRVHPNLYRQWKAGENPDQAYFHTSYTHPVYRIIDEYRNGTEIFSMCWTDMIGVCEKILKVNLYEMETAFEESHVFK